MTMTVLDLDRAVSAGDAGRVTGDQKRPDPEVPDAPRASAPSRMCSKNSRAGGDSSS
jgi:hypothetical protein